MLKCELRNLREQSRYRRQRSVIDNVAAMIGPEGVLNRNCWLPQIGELAMQVQAANGVGKVSA